MSEGYSKAYWDELKRLSLKHLRETRDDQRGKQMRFGEGWYLFRCGRCKQGFMATSMAEWCDCGNVHFQGDGPKKDWIVVEMECRNSTVGSIVVWDHKLEGVGNRTAMKMAEWVQRVRACWTSQKIWHF